ncbi:hypothetical protein CPB86DRAFT_846301 [Serendipita vermifera]|nr:hypothetical protein CPB86DRAFT_846301 [Serendipita vermifera]
MAVVYYLGTRGFRKGLLTFYLDLVSSLALHRIGVHLLFQSSTPPNDLYRMLFFKNITVELAIQDDSFLTDIPHLVLELNQDGRVVDKVNLLSRKSSRGIWDADEPLILREVTGEFMLSVSMQVDDHDRQVFGSIELYEVVGTRFGRLWIQVDSKVLISGNDRPAIGIS